MLYIFVYIVIFCCVALNYWIVEGMDFDKSFARGVFWPIVVVGWLNIKMFGR